VKPSEIQGAQVDNCASEARDIAQAIKRAIDRLGKPKDADAIPVALSECLVTAYAARSMAPADMVASIALAVTQLCHDVDVDKVPALCAEMLRYTAAMIDAKSNAH
jgi:hypothetical protein